MIISHTMLRSTSLTKNNNISSERRRFWKREMKSQYVIGLSLALAGAWFLWGEERFGDSISTELVAILWVGIISYLNQNDLSKLIIALTGRVDNLDGGKRVVETASPIALTDYGRSLSELVKARNMASEYIKEVESSLGDANEYQIQEACADFAENKLLNKLKPDDRAFLEMIAYQEGIEISKILRVVGVEMRDLFLEKRTKQVT